MSSTNNTISSAEAANAGQAAAREGLSLTAQQSNESAEAYAQRVSAYNYTKAQMQQQQEDGKD